MVLIEPEEAVAVPGPSSGIELSELGISFVERIVKTFFYTSYP